MAIAGRTEGLERRESPPTPRQCCHRYPVYFLALWDRLGEGYPFSAPSRTPSRKYRWNTMKKITMGSAASAAPAKITP